MNYLKHIKNYQWRRRKRKKWKNRKVKNRRKLKRKEVIKRKYNVVHVKMPFLSMQEIIKNM